MKQRYSSLQRIAYDPIHISSDRNNHVETEEHQIQSSDSHNNNYASSLTSAASSRIMSNRSHLPPPPTSNSSRNSQIDLRELSGSTPTSQLPTQILSRSYVKQAESHESQHHSPPFRFDNQTNVIRQHSPYQLPANSPTINHQLRNSCLGSHTVSSNIGITTKSLQQSQVGAPVTTTTTTKAAAAETFQSDKIKSFEKIAISVDQLADCVSDYMIITNSSTNNTIKSMFSAPQQMSPYSNISSRSGCSVSTSGMNTRSKIIDDTIMNTFKNLIHATVGNFLVESAQTVSPFSQETRETITAADDHCYYPDSASSRTLLTTKNGTTHCLSNKHMNMLSTEGQYQSTRSDDFSSEIDRLQDQIRELENANRDRDCGQLAEKLQADRIEFESIKADLAEYVRSFKLNFLRVQLRSHRASDIVQSELFNEFYDILTTTEQNWAATAVVVASKNSRVCWNAKFNDDTRLLSIQWQKNSMNLHGNNAWVLKKRSRSCITKLNDGVHLNLESFQVSNNNQEQQIRSVTPTPPPALVLQNEAILEKNAEIQSLKVEKEIEFSIFHTFLRQFTSNARNNLFEDIFETCNQAEQEQEQQHQQQLHGNFNNNNQQLSERNNNSNEFDEIDSQASPSKIELSRFMNYDHRKQAHRIGSGSDGLQVVLPFKNMMEFTIGNEPSELFDNEQPFSSYQQQQQQLLFQQQQQQPNHQFFNSLSQEQQQLLLHANNNHNMNHNRSFNQDIANISCINRVDDGGDAQQAISFLDTLDNKPTSRFMCQSSFKKNRFNPVNWQSQLQSVAAGAIGFNHIDEREEPVVGEGTLFDDDDGDEDNFNEDGGADYKNRNSSNPLAQVGHLKQKLSDEFNRQNSQQHSSRHPSSIPLAAAGAAQALRSKNVPVHMSFDSNFAQNSQNNINHQGIQLNSMQQQQLLLQERPERAQPRHHLESFCGVGEDEEKSRLECFMNENFDEVTNSLNLDQIGDFEDSMIDGPANAIIAAAASGRHHHHHHHHHPNQSQEQQQLLSKHNSQNNMNPTNSNMIDKSKKKLPRKARPSVDLPKLDLSTINYTDTLKNARGSTRYLAPHPTSSTDKNADNPVTTMSQHVVQDQQNVRQAQIGIGGSGGVNSLLSQISPIHRVNFMMPAAQAGCYQLPHMMKDNYKYQNGNQGKQNESMLSVCGNTQLDILRVLNETNGGFYSDSCVVDGAKQAAGDMFLKGICINLERENRFLTEENARLQMAIEKQRVFWEEESMRIRGEFSVLESKKHKYRLAKEDLDARKKQHEETEKLVGQQQLMIVLQEKKILCSKQQFELQWSELEKKRDELERTEKMVSDEWENVKKQASQMQEFIAKQKAMKEMLAREFATSKQTLALEQDDISSKQRMLRKKEVTLDVYEKSLSEREARHKHEITEEKALFAEEVARFKEKNESDTRSMAEVEQKREMEMRDIQKEITLLKSVSKHEAAKYALDLKRLKHIEANLEKREKEFQLKYSAFLQDQLAFSEKQGKIANDSKRMKDLLPSLKSLATKMAGEENDKSSSSSNITTKENDIENGILRARTKRFSQYL